MPAFDPVPIYPQRPLEPAAGIHGDKVGSYLMRLHLIYII